MKFLLVTLVSFLFAIAGTRAESSEYRLRIYSDEAHTSTQANDVGPGVLTLFVVFESTDEADVPFATGSIFRIQSSAGFTGVWLDETSSYTVVGTSPVGVQIGFPHCVALPTRVLSVRYTTFGTSAPCSGLQVVEHPVHGLWGIDCDFQVQVTVGEKLTINPDATCSPVPVRETTWGRIKALYH